VREHGGDIEVESDPGQGTRFLLSFPEMASAQTAAAGAPQLSVATPQAPAATRTRRHSRAASRARGLDFRGAFCSIGADRAV